jgi:ribonuclease Z
MGRSRAADATSLLIPELDMLLDCGCEVSPTRPLYIFITHSHGDHCHDINRFVNKARPPEIYLPISAVQPMADFLEKYQILRAVGRNNRDSITRKAGQKLIGVQPDDLLTLRKTMRVRVFDMDHSVPCCGYGFYESRFKLKKEYEHLSSKEIGNLKRENPKIELSEERLVPLFAFMGDTTASVCETYQAELFQFPLIIIECSFIDNEDHAERAADVKHVIWVRQ